MQKWIISSLLLLAPMLTFAAGANVHAAAQSHGKQVNTKQLKEWIAKKEPLVVLDARSKPYFDGRLLPGAQWIPYDSSEATLIAAIPAKTSTVVVYCAGPGCPASDWMAARLSEMGYTNVYEYPEGITGWTKQGNPTEKQR